MLDIALHSLLVGARDALGVWAVLIALTAFGFALMFAPGLPERVLRARVRADARQLRRARLDAQRRCAQELSTAAASAAVTARRRHAAWEIANTAADKAWQAFEAADAAAHRAVRAAAFAVAAGEPTADDIADRQAALHRAAREAYRQGELSPRQLADIVAGRQGFDARQHPAELETRLRLAIRHHLLHDYLQASAAERVAWRAADIAAAARNSLATEAMTAATEAEHLQQPEIAVIPQQRIGSGRVLHPAVR